MARVTTFSLAMILEKEKLHKSGTNFLDWFCNVSIVLKGAKKDYVLDATPGEPPADNQLKLLKIAINNVVMTTLQFNVLCLLQWNQKRYENWGLFETISELKDLFQQQARAERYGPKVLFRGMLM
jgi:hypothetical protein